MLISIKWCMDRELVGLGSEVDESCICMEVEVVSILVYAVIFLDG